MPLVRITYPRGALTPAQKRQLAGSLTEIALEVEVDTVTAAGRMVTVVHVAQFINADLPAERRAEIAASVARQVRS